MGNLNINDTESASILSIDSIVKRENHNPRRFKSAARRAEMRESIRSKGVLQPILVRPHPSISGKYELVAGETRYDLAIDVGLTSIPALIKMISDDDLRSTAAIENIQRQDMTPMDEGESARELLIKYNGDKDLVAKEMGWSLRKLEGRLQITHCVDEVAQALCDDIISFSHAALLSGLRPKAQVSGLNLVLTEKLSAIDLKKRIDHAALRLDKAIFDKSECSGCPSNSSKQVDLFQDGVEAGRCLNQACFTEKTTAAIEQIKVEQAENFNRIEVLSDVAEGSTVVLVASGIDGVGVAQYKACQGCEHYGATVSDKLHEVGTITKGLCFNLSCHTNMKNSYQNLICTRPASQGATEGLNDDGDVTRVITVGESGSPNNNAPKGDVVAKPASISKKVLERNHEVHRMAASRLFANTATYAKALALLSLISESHFTFKTKPDGWPSSLSGESRFVALNILLSFGEEKIDQIMRSIACKVIQNTKGGWGGDDLEKDTFGAISVGLCKEHSLDLSAEFVMDADYLDMHTKPVIEELLQVSGFAEAFDNKYGAGSFTKMMSTSKKDILGKVKEFDFEFKGFIPPSMRR